MTTSDPEVTEIIVRGIVVGQFTENCWVIGNRRTGEGICVDPGDQPDEVLAMARDMGLRIKYIANSHAHIDHILGVGAVRDATGAKFLLHAGDLEMARNTAAMAKGWMGIDIVNPPDPDAFLSDGDDIDIDGLKLRVLHTPGHTRGSVCFYANGVLFAGDTLFQGSVGRTDLPLTILNRASNEIPKQYLDCAKARARLSWAPHWTLDASLAETVEWYRGWLARERAGQTGAA